MRSRATDLARIFAGLALLARATPAAANGAFPASDAVLVAADRPQQIMLGTNFGLIISDDGGTSWKWTCERTETSMARSYTVGAPPGDRLYALSDLGLAISTDDSCGWHLAGGALAAALASDYFPDPTAPAHVLAVARVTSAAGNSGDAAIYESTDGGDTFAAAPLYTAPTGDFVYGVEIARADPRVIYLAIATQTSQPMLVRSGDAGATWTTIDLQPSIGVSIARIIAVDPEDANVIYLRVSGGGGEQLAVSRDGGMTFALPVTLPDGALTAFARLASGTVLVAGLRAGDGGTTSGAAWRSTDGGMTFDAWTLTPAPRLRALAERGGTLYLAGDNYMDGWALAVSSDEGRTLQPILRYDQVSGVQACVAAVCQDSCDGQAGRRIWGPEVCNPLPADAGSDAGPPPKSSSGCGCDAAATRAGAPGIAALFVAAVLAAARARRSAATRRRPGTPY